MFPLDPPHLPGCQSSLVTSSRKHSQFVEILILSRYGPFPGGTEAKNPLPVRGTQIRPLEQEDFSRRRPTKPVHLNYWCPRAPLRKPTCSTTETHVPDALCSTTRSLNTITKEYPRSPQLEKACTKQGRPNADQKKKKKRKKERKKDMQMLGGKEQKRARIQRGKANNK